ncbi:MAG: hypothetical protein HPY61_05790 [Methanotrichaceae archaeon]|nr:hypothetical protein [Methanotrichaceae archaeon]
MKPIIALCAAVLLVLPQALAAVDDMSVSRVSLACGKWTASFDWSDMDDCKKSLSHSDNQAGRVKITTDTLILTSACDPDQVLKIAISRYSERDDSLANIAGLKKLANDTLVKSKVCGENTLNEIAVCGKKGILVVGRRCSDGNAVYVAAFPVDYCYDGPGGSLLSSAVAVISSNFKPEATERLIRTIEIVQASR